MAQAVVMPKPGNNVESCVLVSWKKRTGDQVEAGDTLCEIETDKAVMAVDSAFSGLMLELFFEEGAEIPVFTNIAAIGEPGESVDALRPAGAPKESSSEPSAPPEPDARESTNGPTSLPSVEYSEPAISPRARRLADQNQVDVSTLSGSGPQGRIIERDVRAAVEQQPAMTPLAKRMVVQGGYDPPPQGTGPRGRILAADLAPGAAQTQPQQEADDFESIPVQGVRRVIAQRLLTSLQTTAQFTLTRSADAEALLNYRERLKASHEPLGLREVTLGDLIHFVVSRVLKSHLEMNARFQNDVVHQFNSVNLAFAVDSPRGLMAPVIYAADRLSLRQISAECKRLIDACHEGTVALAELDNGTFTVTNLGSLEIESFTPILNPPQVAILGVGGIFLKPVDEDGEVRFKKQLSLSLTIDHQAVDGAPAARFLQDLARGLAQIDLLLAV